MLWLVQSLSLRRIAVGPNRDSARRADRPTRATPLLDASVVGPKRSNLLVDVLNKPPGLTFVVIQEVEMEDWGVGGVPVGEYRRRAEAGSTG